MQTIYEETLDNGCRLYDLDDDSTGFHGTLETRDTGKGYQFICTRISDNIIVNSSVFETEDEAWRVGMRYMELLNRWVGRAL